MQVIKSAEQYEALKLSSRALVGYFSAKFSTPAKLYQPRFEEMAKSAPNYTFFVCDVDDAPTVTFLFFDHQWEIVLLEYAFWLHRGLISHSSPYYQLGRLRHGSCWCTVSRHIAIRFETGWHIFWQIGYGNSTCGRKSGLRKCAIYELSLSNHVTLYLSDGAFLIKIWTCSHSHLPSYTKLAINFRSLRKAKLLLMLCPWTVKTQQQVSASHGVSILQLARRFRLCDDSCNYSATELAILSTHILRDVDHSWSLLVGEDSDR